MENTRVVNCFQIRNFEISNNIPRAFLGGVPVVNCFQIRNFVISNNLFRSMRVGIVL